ncbi:MAG: hypothetical protein Q8N98_04400, partial [bacterium]|nr:hypothetical protein [bacterium]
MKTEIDRSREQGARFCEQRQDISRFVGRKRELEIVDERLRIVKEGGKLFQSIVNFHGLPGIGKTALLDNLVPLARDRGFSCIHLDQTDINPDCYLTDKPKPVGLNVLTLEARQKLLWATGSSPESRVLRPEKRTVLCLDEIKLTPEMEDAFIVPLAETEDSVVVVAGPTPQKWIDFAA